MSRRFHWKSDIKYDLALLSETESVNPFTVPVSKSGTFWEQIAYNLVNSNLKLPVCARRCRERVTELVNEHNGKEALSVKASGVSEEEMSEIVQLLTSVASMKELTPECLTKKVKRSLAEDTRLRALNEIEIDRIMVEPDEERLFAEDISESPEVRTTQEFLEGTNSNPPARKKVCVRKRKEESTEEVIEYLKNKAEKQMDFKNNELQVRSAEAENRRMELELQKERQAADLEDRKVMREFMLRMLTEKTSSNQ